MTTGLETVGDAATGAILARAVEPTHGEGSHAAPAACLNCGTHLVGPHCHACGQNGHLHRTIGGFLHDIVHGVFHFEGKIWATLPLLFLKPGELTRRYIAGERAKFVSPIALFLFCVFLMFAVVGSLAGTMHTPEIRASDRNRSLGEIQTARAKNEEQVKSLRAQVRAAERAGQDSSALESRIDDLEGDTDSLKVAERFLKSGNRDGNFTDLTFSTRWHALDRGLAAANENPNLFLYRLQTSAYKYSWLLIPLSTPFVWLLFFWKRQYKFYDHLVFVTFSLTFMLLLVTALTLFGWLGLSATIIALIALIVPPVHIYKQVRGAYASGRATALVRTGALLVFGLVVLTLYLAILLAMGIMK